MFSDGILFSFLLSLFLLILGSSSEFINGLLFPLLLQEHWASRLVFGTHDSDQTAACLMHSHPHLSALGSLAPTTRCKKHHTGFPVTVHQWSTCTGIAAQGVSSRLNCCKFKRQSERETKQNRIVFQSVVSERFVCVFTINPVFPLYLWLVTFFLRKFQELNGMAETKSSYWRNAPSESRVWGLGLLLHMLSLVEPGWWDGLGPGLVGSILAHFCCPRARVSMVSYVISLP